MKTKQDHKPIKELVDLFTGNFMIVNSEYQRGVVWTDAQQKRLIDSLMRGYTLPLIYLHEKREQIGDRTRDGLDIIDGQQRLIAISRYVKGDYRLFDPKTENHIAKFPLFLQNKPCEWAGKHFHELSDDLKGRFLGTKLMLVLIQSPNNDEVRDLFIRLQAGSALNEQERRDAWPGGMNDFVLRLGGKPSIMGCPGHEFFKEVMRARPGSDRGRTRQLAAQITSLLIAQQKNSVPLLPDINATAIDQLYYDHLNFDSDGRIGKRIWKVFDLLLKLLKDGKRPPLRNHDAIHAALLVNRLLDDFTPNWQAEFAQALDTFLLNLKNASVLGVEETDPQYKFVSQYGVLTRANSADGRRILQRHTFYVEQMLQNMPSTALKDSKRDFCQAERELIYLRQKKLCAVCESDVYWEDVEIHHIQEHQGGGKTELKNAALVHKLCHPKTEEEVAVFANKWAGRK